MKNWEVNSWPRKYKIFGIDVSETSYEQALDAIIKAAKVRRPSCVSHLAVHGLILGSTDPLLKIRLNEFDILAPDGQPVRFALNLLYKTKLQDRCYGPEFMSRVCECAAIEGIGVYLYGSHPHVVKALHDRLTTTYHKLKIVGHEPSAFRPLGKDEDEELVQRINKSRAGIVFIGLGCPLQEKFAYEHRKKIKAVQICVGAAFDFHAGNKKMAPAWMQRHSLEWLFRLLQEPQRLWRRYLFTNSVFLFNLVLQYTGLKKFNK